MTEFIIIVVGIIVVAILLVMGNEETMNEIKDVKENISFSERVETSAMKDIMGKDWVHPLKRHRDAKKIRNKLSDEELLNSIEEWELDAYKRTIATIKNRININKIKEMPFDLNYKISDGYWLTFNIDKEYNLTYVAMHSGGVSFFAHETCKLEVLDLYRHNIDSGTLSFLLYGMNDYLKEYKNDIRRPNMESLNDWCEQASKEDYYSIYDDIEVEEINYENE